jgi:molybdopterin-guanine dinucleotide biosynthesis protein
MRLVETHSYFVVHAPRQTGKTTAMPELARELTASDRHALGIETDEYTPLLLIRTDFSS